jgi:hypothetical protein
MARKRAAGKSAMQAQAEVKTMPVRLDMPPEAHKLLRIIAGFRSESMAAAARNLLIEALGEQAKKYGVRL